MIRCYSYFFFFFFNDTATTEIYTLSLHDALPIWRVRRGGGESAVGARRSARSRPPTIPGGIERFRSEEHTSELQSRSDIVCRLLLEKKKTHNRCYTLAVLDQSVSHMLCTHERSLH